MRLFASPSIPLRRSAQGVFAGALLVLGACSLGESAPTFRYGVVTIRGAGSSSGSVDGPFVAAPTAVFFTAPETQVPNSVTTVDFCSLQSYVVEQIAPGNMRAGESLQVDVGSDTYSMIESDIAARIYVLSSGPAFLYQAGDTARITSPGLAGGFPGGQVAVRLAEPVRLGPLMNPVMGEDFPISWETNGDARSGIVISMRYAATSTAGAPDQQYLCIVRDNGAYTIPGSSLTDWYMSPPALREVNVMRWRTNVTEIDERSIFHVVSTIDTTAIISN